MLLSACCKKEVRVVDGTFQYYVCDNCDRPCKTIDASFKLKSTECFS